MVRRLHISQRPGVRSWRTLCICLLFQTFCAQLFALDPNQPLRQLHHTSWTARDGLTGSVLALAQSADGYLWIGTSDGLFRFDGLTFERYKPDTGSLKEDGVSALFAASDGALWIGYDHGGVSFLKGGRLTSYAPVRLLSQSGLPGSRVNGFSQTRDGTIWVAAVQGLARFERGNWLRVGSEWEGSGRQIQSLLVDHDGNLWVGTYRSVRFLPLGGTHFQPADARDTAVRSVSQERDGTVWCAYEGKFWEAIRKPGDNHRGPLPRIDVPGFKSLFDHDGALWIASRPTSPR